MTRAFVIGNPGAGRGRVGKEWTDLIAAIRTHGLDVQGRLTDAPGHAVDLARQARADGVDLVVAAGGDGTVHEVVNGLLADGTGTEIPELGVVPGGSGCDYAKTFGIPEDIAGAVSRLASEVPPRAVDVAEVRFQTEGGEVRRFFANISGVGIGAEVVQRAARLPRALGGAVYFASFVLTLPGFERRRARIELDDQIYEGPLTNLVVANAQYFGGGMRVAPAADPGDGVFDVQIQFGSKLDYARGITKVYSGKHIPHPRIKEVRSSRLLVHCDPPALVEADGEVLGRTPAAYSILSGAMRLKA
ncbi:MAG: diacylglycerol kinase family protein [Actinomycetota bacterium]